MGVARMSRSLGEVAAQGDAISRQFASDNYAPICPEAWQALMEANQDHAVSYGDDPFTRRAVAALRDFFETDCDVYFTFNGTAANALCVASMCRSYQAVICHEWAHLATDECAAPEFFSGGAKVLTVSSGDGRLGVLAVQERIAVRTDVHFSQVRALSITQATEVGTIYSCDQVAALAQLADDRKLHFHMDGARFANAVVSLGVMPKELTWRVGVKVLSLGGTKNGLPVGDVVVFFDRELAREFEYRRKQAGQLASKMRFLTAPWCGVLESGAYLTHARHANQMASRLRSQLAAIEGVKLLFATEANSVFVDMDAVLREGLRRRGWKFYALMGDNVCRLMCAWDTAPSDVDRLCQDVRDLVS